MSSTMNKLEPWDARGTRLREKMRKLEEEISKCKNNASKLRQEAMESRREVKLWEFMVETTRAERMKDELNALNLSGKWLKLEEDLSRKLEESKLELSVINGGDGARSYDGVPCQEGYCKTEDIKKEDGDGEDIDNYDFSVDQQEAQAWLDEELKGSHQAVS